MKPTGKAYAAQLQSMAANAKAWHAANPGREVKVQFNFPPKVCVIATISDAIKNLYVVTNDAGLQLIKALAPWHCEEEPTVLMVRVVLENFKEIGGS